MNGLIVERLPGWPTGATTSVRLLTLPGSDPSTCHAARKAARPRERDPARLSQPNWELAAFPLLPRRLFRISPPVRKALHPSRGSIQSVRSCQPSSRPILLHPAGIQEAGNNLHMAPLEPALPRTPPPPLHRLTHSHARTRTDACRSPSRG